MLAVMNRTEPPTLIDLPRELLHNIAAECNPPDLGKISRSCRTLHDYILGDRLVFRDVFLRHYVSSNNWHESSDIDLGIGYSKQ